MTSESVRALLDTTVFCGALLAPDGTNHKILELAASGLYVPVISQAVLAEFIKKAVVDGLGPRRIRYEYDDVIQFLEALGPLTRGAVPVGVRDILDVMRRIPGFVRLRAALAQAASGWPEGLPISAFDEPAAAIDPKDAHLYVVYLEHSPTVVVTSNVDHLAPLAKHCPVERPGKFLTRFGL